MPRYRSTSTRCSSRSRSTAFSGCDVATPMETSPPPAFPRSDRPALMVLILISSVTRCGVTYCIAALAVDIVFGVDEGVLLIQLVANARESPIQYLDETSMRRAANEETSRDTATGTRSALDHVTPRGAWFVACPALLAIVTASAPRQFTRRLHRNAFVAPGHRHARWRTRQDASQLELLPADMTQRNALSSAQLDKQRSVDGSDRRDRRRSEQAYAVSRL